MALSMPEVLERARRVRAAVFDVDGVLTDGRLWFDSEGRETKAFHVHDGLGLKLLMRNGIDVAVISGRDSAVVEARMAALGIEHVFQGVPDKLPAYRELLERLGLPPERTAFVGDEILDLPVMTRAGLGIAVADAHPETAARAHWQTTRPGGRGAAREVCDLLLRAQDRLDGIVAGYLADPA